MYDTPQKIADTLKELGQNPMSVNDGDGNLYIAYKVTKNHAAYFINQGFEPTKTQDIPLDLNADELDALVEKGILEHSLFAAKTMDVRLPMQVVRTLNTAIEHGDVFKICLLTSRAMPEVLQLYKASGVTHPEKATIVADKGSSMYVHGIRHDARVLTQQEQHFMDGMARHTATDWMDGVRGIIAEHGFDPEKSPALYFERKGIAGDVHHRAILDHYLNPERITDVNVEGTPLDLAIGRYISERLVELNAQVGPAGFDGQPVFSLIGGPCVSELGITKINKGHGLQAILEKAMHQPKAKIPTGVLLTGDDLYDVKTNGPGTDFHFFTRANELAENFALPIRTSHTLHPEHGIDGTEPDMAKDIICFPEERRPRVDLRIPNPAKQSGVVLSLVGYKSGGQEARPTIVSAPEPVIP